MAFSTITRTLPLPRWQSSWSIFAAPNSAWLQYCKLHKTRALRAVSKRNSSEPKVQDVASNGEILVEEESKKTSPRAPRRSRKKKTPEILEESHSSASVSDVSGQENASDAASIKNTKKVTRKPRKKATQSSSDPNGETGEKNVSRRRKTKKETVDMKDQGSGAELSDHDEPSFLENAEDEEDLDFSVGEEDDISFTYSWPPLICCFGAAQHAFVPSGRPANRLIDYEIHERMKDALWKPEKFVRSPGGCAGSVAIALTSLGGRVAFMGKLGNDDYGQTMLYYLNVNNVQTRSVRVDSKKMTAVSHMKLIKRGGLRMTCVKPCAEDCLSRSEINMDVLKEAKMFYFNSSSLLSRDMRLTTLQAIKISKKLGGIIFFDLNLPLPLWQSGEETKKFILEAWRISDIVEVTKQELEFLCGIEPSEKFDTNDNDKSKFIHYKPEVVMPLWHENLKVLFVTNGTSKVHYYTEKHHGLVHGMEDAPITPFTCDMSASGDGIVAGLMRMLTVQPHLITDREYLDRTIKYAIDCGIIDQWILGRTRGFPRRENMEDEVVSDPNGIRSITEREYRTVESVG